MTQVTIEQALQIGIGHHQAGRLAEAEGIYRQILAQQPEHAEALHLLGVIASQVGRNDVAVDLIRRAITRKPHFPEAHSNLGNALKEQGRLDEAMAAYRQAIALKPDFADAYCNLGNALWDKGQFDDAIAACRRAIALKPDFADAYSNLGNALWGKRQFEDAIAACRQAIALKPDFAKAYCNLGNALKDNGELEAAMAAYRQALAIKPDFAEAHNNLGNALRESRQTEAAMGAYRQALAIKPDYADAHNNLGNVLKDEGSLDAAIAAFRQAIACKPDLAEAHSNLGWTLAYQGKLDEALAAYHQAIALKPKLTEAHSNLILSMHYDPDCRSQAIAEEHRRWNRQHAEPLKQFMQPHANERDPERRLRIGYVSPDFREHAVGRFLLPLLANHDKTRFEVYAYAQVPFPDAMTQQLRLCTDGWRDMVKLSDAQAADQIRHDQIDILVDLAGHTAHNRLLVFARKPAPIQVTWLGFPGATGLETIDYRLSDSFADPPTPPGESDPQGSEKIIRLDPTAWCFAPIFGSPEITPLPALQNKYITFGTFNNFAKVNLQLLELWAQILQQVPTSRLLLKNLSLGTPSVIARLQAFFAARNIAPERLQLLPLEPDVRQHLERYRHLDIALDTHPYDGTTTTCEALWMGVPVITLPGSVHAARVGVSLLSNVGLPELVAHSEEEYVRIAGDLAGDLPRLGELRWSLREKMEQSPLMDAPRFARNVEAAYREMWRKWCAEGKP